MLKSRLMKAQCILALGAILLAACGGSAPDATPTMGVDQIQTYAVSTFSSALTLTAISAPTETPSPTQTTAPTVAPTSTGGTPFSAGNTPGVPVSGATTSCYGLTFVKDVTIPDNTQMDPGETFTKTWQVLNSGSCAWDSGFQFKNTGGSAMGGSAFTIPSSVAPGSTYEISVSMTAPSATGTVRGNWRMSNTTGFFGDEVFVVINVGGSAAATNTSSAPASTQTTTTP